MKTDMKVMIIKPPNYYCGIGIKLINNTGNIISPTNSNQEL